MGERERLKAQREPYWQRLRAGCFLGFRPSKRGGGSGTWIARIYEEDTGKYRVKSLGDFGSLVGNERFAAAKKAAEAVAELVESGGIVRNKIETVEDACRDYAKTRPEAEQRFGRYVYPDSIAKLKLDKLRRHHVKEWRERLETTPTLLKRTNDQDACRKRAASTINRDMVPLRAALSKVLPFGTPNSEAAWQEALKAIPNADGRRTLYLDIGQRKALLANLNADVVPFVRALCLLPLRPGAIASLVVEDFDKRTSELSIGKDKTGRSRRIQLPYDAAALFEEQSRDKLGQAPIFMQFTGRPWNKNSWKRPIAKAVMIANLPPKTTAYTLRHSTITDLVRAGLPLLTIAQISGTSAEMIERHYGHLASDAAVRALAELAL